MDLRQVLSDYQKFLVSSYAALPAWMIDGDDANDPVADWCQANWEILVEYRIQRLGMNVGHIDVYGDGADCSGGSSRVFMPDAQSSRSIRINEKFVFHSFGALRRETFVPEPPFEYVKGECPKNGEEIVVEFDKATFSIGETYDDAV